MPLCSISPLISAEACAADCASRRTSTATTAKPLPASPARAASTEALSARRLVWNAMSSISPMMLEILRRRGGDPLHRVVREPHHLAALGRRLRHRLRLEARLRGAARRCRPPSRSTARSRSRSPRWSRPACVVRSERSLAPERISPVAVFSDFEAPRSAVTVAVSVSPTLLTSSRSSPKAPWNSPRMRCVRSALASAASTCAGLAEIALDGLDEIVDAGAEAVELGDRRSRG